MKSRCLNKLDARFNSYGGRGVAICPKWMEFKGFLEDMGERPPNTSIDRIDVNGNYCKENCRWATRLQQARNKRNTLLVKFSGETVRLKEVSERTGLPYLVLYRRVVTNGLDVNEAVYTNPAKPFREGKK